MSKRVVILGSGESGTGAAILCRKQGFDVFVSDKGTIPERFKNDLHQHHIAFEEEKHTNDKILSADEIIKSPGIPEKSPVIQEIRNKGTKVISEIELAYRYKEGSKIVAITGSNGKTTTTALTGHICKTAGANAAVVGNIGYSFARQVALDPKPLYIVEVSSFQLDDIDAFNPDVAILTNITEDHLDRYDYKFENYIHSKFNIIKNQTHKDYFIYCADDPVITKHLQTHPLISNPLPFTMHYELPKGAFIRENKMSLHFENEVFEMNVLDFALKGKHNQYNTMAAGLAGMTIGIRKEKIREAVKTFESLEHRMENVVSVRGVQFINDSKATNVNSTWFALESMTQPVILILGGVDKGNDYSLIRSLIREKVKAIVCMGLDNRKIHEAFGKDVETMVNTTSAREAVHSAFQLADKGDVVLLSPACSSFDLFKNYEDRGKQFKEAVREL